MVAITENGGMATDCEYNCDSGGNNTFHSNNGDSGIGDGGSNGNVGGGGGDHKRR